MRRLKSLTAKLGHSVSGSDASTTGHRKENIDGADLVVFSGAIKPNNEELAFARQCSIPCVERSEYLGAIADGYDRVVAIAGSHGKTTATAMTAKVASELKPTVHIGADYDYLKDEEKSLFITEACEYRKSLLFLRPTIGVVLNSDLDHTDCYKSVDEIAQVFGEFASLSQTVLYNGDDERLKRVMPPCSLSFGLKADNDFSAFEIERTSDERYRFELIFKGKSLGKIETSVKGIHNLYNALVSASVGVLLGVPFSKIQENIRAFTGVKRRNEIVGEINGAQVISDYAHHPTEIKATLSAITAKNRVIAVFEPHTYSRTRDLFDGFISSFSRADEVLLLPVYASRESEDKVNSITLTSEIKKRQKASYFSSYDELSSYLRETVRSGDTVVFLGAGTIDKCARELVNKC